MSRAPNSGRPQLLCPSSDPAMPEAVAFGVVLGSVHEPRLRHLETPLPVTNNLLSLALPAMPTAAWARSN